MNEDFFRLLFQKQRAADAVPSNEEISGWASELIHLLFPELSKRSFSSPDDLKNEFRKLEAELCRIMEATKACRHCDHARIARDLFSQVPELHRLLNTDIQAIFLGDPAA